MSSAHLPEGGPPPPSTCAETAPRSFGSLRFGRTRNANGRSRKSNSTCLFDDGRPSSPVSTFTHGRLSLDTYALAYASRNPISPFLAIVVWGKWRGPSRFIKWKNQSARRSLPRGTCLIKREQIFTPSQVNRPNAYRALTPRRLDSPLSYFPYVYHNHDRKKLTKPTHDDATEKAENDRSRDASSSNRQRFVANRTLDGSIGRSRDNV